MKRVFLYISLGSVVLGWILVAFIIVDRNRHMEASRQAVADLFKLGISRSDLLKVCDPKVVELLYPAGKPRPANSRLELYSMDCQIFGVPCDADIDVNRDGKRKRLEVSLMGGYCSRIDGELSSERE